MPYQYTLILWSVLFGRSLFGELPDADTIAGATIIVAAGLYIFWREQTRDAPLTPGPGDAMTAPACAQGPAAK